MFCTFIETNIPKQKCCKNEGCTNCLITDNPPEKCIAECEAFPKVEVIKPIPFVYQPLNFTKALLKYIKSGGKKVTKEQYEERLKICEECRYRDPETNKCTVCGCKLSGIFNKSMLPKERCPLGKWPPLK